MMTTLRIERTSVRVTAQQLMGSVYQSGRHITLHDCQYTVWWRMRASLKLNASLHATSKRMQLP